MKRFLGLVACAIGLAACAPPVIPNPTPALDVSCQALGCPNNPPAP